MMINLIVACGYDGQIGKNNKLLWHIPEDFKSFKRLTSNHVIIMGRNTFESLPGMLPNRIHIVISSKELEQKENLFVVKSLEEAIEKAKDISHHKEEQVWVIGGGKVYQECLEKNIIDRIYLSLVDYNGPADTYINLFYLNNFNLIFSEKYSKTEETPKWEFKIYKKDCLCK